MASGVVSPGSARVDTAALDLGLLVLRLGVAGLMLALHGWARLGRAFSYSVLGTEWPFTNLVAGLGFPMAGMFAVASALSESIGAILVGIGLFTRPAAMFLAIDMTVALYNEMSGADPIELPALYFIAALTVVMTGPGRYGLDTILSRRREWKAARMG
jgi:putative oxidoreductase